MKKIILLLLSPLVLLNVAIAAESQNSGKKPSAEVNISNGTDVIGSKDAPLVLNIVPWKDKEHILPKNPLSPSVLQTSVAPIEQDVELREAAYSRALQELLPLSTVNP